MIPYDVSFLIWGIERWASYSRSRNVLNLKAYTNSDDIGQNTKAEEIG